MKSEIDWINNKNEILNNLNKMKTMSLEFTKDIDNLIKCINDNNDKIHQKLITSICDNLMEMDDDFHVIHHSFAVYIFNKSRDKYKNKLHFKNLKCKSL